MELDNAHTKPLKSLLWRGAGKNEVVAERGEICFVMFCFQMEGTVWLYPVRNDPEESKQSLVKI